MRHSAFIVFMLAASAAYGERGAEQFTRLLSAHSIRCQLGQGTQASWDGGKLKLESVNFGKAGQVTFDSIDANSGKARIIANAGAGDVFVLATPVGLTFIEQTAVGNINFTTVLPLSIPRLRIASSPSRRVTRI
jgi:hypothetical protein